MSSRLQTAVLVRAFKYSIYAEQIFLFLKLQNSFYLECIFWDVALRGSYKSHTANIPEDGIIHSNLRENLKSYIVIIYF
jgi:hypothetical protein